MANIGELNFEVIVSDKQFDAKIKEIENKAKQFNTSLSNILNINKVSTQMSQAEVENARRVHQARVDSARAQERINREKIRTEGLQKRINAQIEKASKGYQSQGRILQELKGYALGYLSIHGATQLLSSLVRVTGEFELQKTTLAAMLGDLNKAEGVITRIQGLAVESPFQFKELTTYAKQLSAFSVPAQELYDTTKMLADISAGLGVGMDRIVLAYGQVRSAAFLRGQEVRQFTEAGIPILDELAKQFSELEGRAVSTGEVFDRISARLVPFEMVAKVFKDMTSEGGKFYNMQQVQAETLRGKISNLKDAYEMMLNEIGEGKSGMLKGAVDGARNLMKNWEKVGDVLITVAHAFGLYKAAMLGAWAVEKYNSVAKIVERYDKLNAVMIANGKTVNKLKNAWIALGASKKAAVGGIIAVVGALATSIGVAIKNATELRRELSSILSSQESGSSKMTGDLDRLVSKLKEATQGTQEYRDIIGEINRRYGEYLPKVLKEAEAYDAVKASADAAAEAIRNKARANAFEQGSAAIENKYRNQLTGATDWFKGLLETFDVSISRDIASEFIKNFNLALEEEGGADDIYKTFRTSFDKYFGEGAFMDFSKSFGANASTVRENLANAAKNYAKYRLKIISAEKDLQEQIDDRFTGATFSSLEERKEVGALEEKYRGLTEALKKQEMTQKAYNDELKKLNLKKLEELATLYDKLGMTKIADGYREQLKALTEIPKGWVGIVQQTLDKMGLNKGTSFGLWAEDTTQSTSYVEDMIKRYKELGEEIKWVSTFDKDQAERLKKNKDAIETIAKALNIDIKNLAANDSDTWESREERRIKRLIDTLRKLQDQYDKLKSLGVSDDAIKSLFNGWFPELGEDFFNDMDFLKRADEASKQLKKLSPEDAGKSSFDIGIDKSEDYIRGLEAREKAYKESAKAAGEYFNTLRKWATEDFNLDGEGITLDVSKIASELSEKMNEIDLRARKAKETFGQIDVDSEEEVAKVKEIFTKEFGADAWTEFWKSYQEKGAEAIENLTTKQKEYEKKLAQEKVNDLAKKYVKESYFEGNINLTDLGDKNILQLIELKRRLQELQSDSSLQIPAELEAELKKLGITTEKFGQIISKVIGTDLSDLTEEMKKEFLELGRLAVSQIRGIMSALGDLAEASGDKGMSNTIRFLEDSADVISSAVQGFSTGGWIGAAIAGVGSLAQKLINVATEAAQADREMKEFESDVARIIREFEQAQLLESFSGIFGDAEFSRYLENVKLAQDGWNKVLEIKREISEIDKYNLNKDDDPYTIYAPPGGQFGSTMYPNASGTKLKFDTQNWWGELWGKKDKTFDLSSLFDESDAPIESKFEELRKTYEKYGKDLSAEDQKVVKDLLENWDRYTEAQKENIEFLNSLFSDLAANVADSMINSFLEVGDAAAGLEDIFDDLSKNVARSLLKDFLLTNIINKYKDNIQSAFDKSKGMSDESFWATFNQQIGLMKAELASAGPEINKMLSEVGLGEGIGQSLADGIKGITEDTANLLASYLNAIRADVSYSKTIWERMDATTQRIAAALAGFSAPSLMEYQAQIAANTYNTALNTQEILSRLDSVITSSDGPTGIRVYS